jgi:hypothetical protein
MPAQANDSPKDSNQTRIAYDRYEKANKDLHLKQAVYDRIDSGNLSTANN